MNAFPDRLDAARIAGSAGRWAERILVVPTVDSTNRLARELAEQGAPAGTSVFAEQQTAGRGRRGRRFYSPDAEGLYLSVILRPHAKPEQLLPLTAMAAVAACDAIGAVCGVRPAIKWTNDLLLGGRKLAGILTELFLAPGTRDCRFCIVGIGVNVAQRRFPEDISETATSLLLETGKPVSRNALAAALVDAFARMEASLFEPERWMTRFAADCVSVGKRVRVLRGDSVREAEALAVTKTGALTVRYDDGSTEDVFSGEVSVRGLNGYF